MLRLLETVFLKYFLPPRLCFGGFEDVRCYEELEMPGGSSLGVRCDGVNSKGKNKTETTI